MRSASRYFTTAQIAKCEGTYRRAILRRAWREHWPRRRSGNEMEFQPSGGLAARCAAMFPEQPQVDYTRLLAELRRATGVYAVLDLLQKCPAWSLGRAVRVVVENSRDSLKYDSTSLRRWLALAERDGLAGLADHRAGRSGRKAAR